MRIRGRTVARYLLLGVGGTLAVLVVAALLFLRFGAGPAADRILSNVRPTEDRELPVTAQAIRQSSADIAKVGGMGQGLNCSLPEIVESLVFPRLAHEASINLQIRQACVFHDLCYRHGAATYGYSQQDCDLLLQEQAFRLCRFYMSAARLEACYTRSRLVVLGVRFGGSQSFRNADSTYFEFDPYPSRSRGYKVVRIADAPAAWLQAGAESKAIYVFDVRPSGVRVTAFARHRSNGADPGFCAGYELPARFGMMVTAPVVTQLVTGEDVFVWWWRRDLNQTGGRFLTLAPGRAELRDWARLTGIATTFAPDTACARVVQPADTMALFRAGERFPLTAAGELEADLEFSEIQFAPWRTGGREMGEAFALMTHTCVKHTNLICFLKFGLDGGSGALRLVTDDAKGFAARTGVQAAYGTTPGVKEKEEDRYRSFVQAPFVLRDGGQALVAFSRRGDAKGEGYNDTTVIRRFGVVKKNEKLLTGQSFGRVLLRDHREVDDPLIIVGNQDVARTRVLSLRALATNDEAAALELADWVMPPAVKEVQGQEAVDVPQDRQMPRHTVALCDGMTLAARDMRFPPAILKASTAPMLVLFQPPAQFMGPYDPALEAVQRNLVVVPLAGLAAGAPPPCLQATAVPVVASRPLKRASKTRAVAAAPEQAALTGADPYRLLPEFADMDGDGRWDLVLVDRDSPWLSFRGRLPSGAAWVRAN